MNKQKATQYELAVTSVQVYPVKDKSKTKAIARVVINDQLQLTGLRIVDGVNGFFVSYPLDPCSKEENYHSIYYPLTKELREHIEQRILEEYQELSMSKNAKSKKKQNFGTFKDPRDGKVYRTVKIGNQTWLAENLAFECDGSKCYENDPKNAEKYGFLYNWETAKTVCPAGWHLPSNVEWQELVRFADGTSGTESPYDSPTAGRRLKATSGWNNNGNGTDAFGFAALPGGAGFSNGFFIDVGYSGLWWSASEVSSNGAYTRGMGYYDELAYYGNGNKDDLYSVRCLQDCKSEGIS
jgi:uncharacterized protein (TIGR02145 family)